VTRAEIKIAGFGGQGVISAGIIVGKAASIFDKFHATMIQAFGPEARGSACSTQVVVDQVPIAYPYIQRPSVLVAFNQEAYELFEPQLRDDGLLLYEEDMVTLRPNQRATLRTFGVPATRIAEEVGRSMVQNVVMVGFFTAFCDFLTYESVQKAVLDSIPAATKDLNLAALKRGYEHGQKVRAGNGVAAASR
jgi:2-oxoglutarate ferredoxin oxidoreductase subunit gamma